MKKALLLSLLVISMLSATVTGTNRHSQGADTQNTEASQRPQLRCNLPDAA